MYHQVDRKKITRRNCTRASQITSRQTKIQIKMHSINILRLFHLLYIEKGKKIKWNVHHWSLIKQFIAYLSKLHFLKLGMKISNVQENPHFCPLFKRRTRGKIFCTLLIFISRFWKTDFRTIDSLSISLRRLSLFNNSKLFKFSCFY